MHGIPGPQPAANNIGKCQLNSAYSRGVSRTEQCKQASISSLAYVGQFQWQAHLLHRLVSMLLIKPSAQVCLGLQGARQHGRETGPLAVSSTAATASHCLHCWAVLGWRILQVNLQAIFQASASLKVRLGVSSCHEVHASTLPVSAPCAQQQCYPAPSGMLKVCRVAGRCSGRRGLGLHL